MDTLDPGHCDLNTASTPLETLAVELLTFLRKSTILEHFQFCEILYDFTRPALPEIEPIIHIVYDCCTNIIMEILLGL